VINVIKLLKICYFKYKKNKKKKKRKKKFSSPDSLLYFPRKRAKLGSEIVLFAMAGKPKYCAWLEKLSHIIKICFSTYFALSDLHVI